MTKSANEASYKIVLSDDQREAVAIVEAWLAHPEPKPQRFSLGGFAGTGKTTLIKFILQSNPSRFTGVCALTGKAAYVLRSKGIDATTMHRMIYFPVRACESCGMPEKEMPNTPDGWWCSHASVKMTFKRHPSLPYDLIVVDEASMVNRELMTDLESFQIPVLYVGDHGQLEPIGDNPGLMLYPDVKIEKIHRQAEGSAILQLAHHVRLGKQPITMGDNARISATMVMPQDAHEYDAILCGFNKTRVAVNEKIRRRFGRTLPGPMEGDRLMCLRNDHDRGLFNGMLLTCTAVREARRGGHDVPVLDCVDDLGETWESLPFVPAQFGQEKTLRELSTKKVLFDYGYCMTVHRAQGSEWKRVLILEQIGRNWEPARWRYTAITRASEEVLYCVSPGRR